VAKKSPNNQGSSRQRPDGRWEWRISLPNGKRKSFYGETQGQARQKAQDAIRDMEKGVDISIRTVTVSVFLARWLEDTAKQRVRPSTLEIYQNHKKRYLDPAFGTVKLKALTPEHVNKMMADMVTRGLSPSTANRTRATLRNALASAVKWGYVSQNVAALADPRTVERTRITPLELDEIRRFLAFTRNHKHGPLFHVAIMTGLRQGELLALRWGPDVDITRGVIHVHHTLTKDYGNGRFNAPKTHESRRTVKLTDSAIDALRRQQGINVEQQMMAAHRWQEYDLVFPSMTGTPLDNSAITRRLRMLLEAAKLPRQRFHDLRHATASLLLAEGMDIFTVKEILSHSQISLTANTYGHLMKKLSENAAIRLNRAIQTGDVDASIDPN